MSSQLRNQVTSCYTMSAVECYCTDLEINYYYYYYCISLQECMHYNFVDRLKDIVLSVR